MNSPDNLLRDESFLSEVQKKFPQAFQQNPRMVSLMAKCCLRFKHFSIDSAMLCLGYYIDWRIDLFGNLEDQEISKHSKIVKQLQSGFIHVSPVKLESGELVLFLVAQNHNPAEFSTSDTIKCFHFLIMSLMQKDPKLAESGFILVNNMSNIEFANLDMYFPGAIASAVGRSIPVRLVKIIIVNPPFLISFVIPLIKAVLPVTLLQRLFLVSDMNELLFNLNLPSSQLPIQLGGSVKVDTDQMIVNMIDDHWVA